MATRRTVPSRRSGRGVFRAASRVYWHPSLTWRRRVTTAPVLGAVSHTTTAAITVTARVPGVVDHASTSSATATATVDSPGTVAATTTPAITATAQVPAVVGHTTSSAGTASAAADSPASTAADTTASVTATGLRTDFAAASAGTTADATATAARTDFAAVAATTSASTTVTGSAEQQGSVSHETTASLLATAVTGTVATHNTTAAADVTATADYTFALALETVADARVEAVRSDTRGITPEPTVAAVTASAWRLDEAVLFHTTTSTATVTANVASPASAPVNTIAQVVATAGATITGAAAHTTTASALVLASATGLRMPLQVQTMDRLGSSAIFTPANVNGHKVRNDGRLILAIRNASAQTRTVRVVFHSPHDTVDVTDGRDIRVPPWATDLITERWPWRVYNQADGSMWIEYPDVTGLSIAALAV